MVGKYNIELSNNYTKYFFSVERNITIIQGNSASGKSELVRLLTSYERDGVSSGISVRSDVPLHVVDSRNWQLQIQSFSDSIIFIDETGGFVKPEEFARLAQKNANYFVIINRDPLRELSYSVREIYGFKASREAQKYHGAYRVYNEMVPLYHLQEPAISPDVVITEDTNSGYAFFQKMFSCSCLAAGGKGRIIEKLTDLQAEQKGLIIVDGAAFGSEIAQLLTYLNSHRLNCTIYAPESFEYLLLKAGFVPVQKEKLSEPYNFADSLQYISWEDFFTRTLISETQGTPFQYTKRKLNPVYMTDSALAKIAGEIPPEIRQKDGKGQS